MNSLIIFGGLLGSDRSSSASIVVILLCSIILAIFGVGLVLGEKEEVTISTRQAESPVFTGDDGVSVFVDNNGNVVLVDDDGNVVTVDNGTVVPVEE